MDATAIQWIDDDLVDVLAQGQEDEDSEAASGLADLALRDLI